MPLKPRTCALIAMLNLPCSMHAFADDRSDEELQRINDSLRILERYPNNPQAREDIIKAMQELGLFEQTVPRRSHLGGVGPEAFERVSS